MQLAIPENNQTNPKDQWFLHSTSSAQYYSPSSRRNIGFLKSIKMPNIDYFLIDYENKLGRDILSEHNTGGWLNSKIEDNQDAIAWYSDLGKNVWNNIYADSDVKLNTSEFVKKFSSIPSVEQIYLVSKSDFVEVNVILNLEYISNKDLEIFFDKELEILNMSDDLLLSFHYFPIKTFNPPNSGFSIFEK